MALDPSVTDARTQQRLARLCRRYIKASFVCLSLGLLLGFGMFWFGNDNLRFAHTHLLMIGFVLFLIYGIGYKLIPTMFFGLPIVANIGLAEIQFHLAWIGLLGMIVASQLPVGLGLDRIGGVFAGVEVAAGLLFAHLMTRTLKGAK